MRCVRYVLVKEVLCLPLLILTSLAPVDAIFFDIPRVLLLHGYSLR